MELAVICGAQTPSCAQDELPLLWLLPAQRVAASHQTGVGFQLFSSAWFSGGFRRALKGCRISLVSTLNLLWVCQVWGHSAVPSVVV